MTDVAAGPGAPVGAADLPHPGPPGEADPFPPAWRVVAVAGVLVVVAFGVGWAALVRGGDNGAALPGNSDAAAGPTHATAAGAGGTTDRLPRSQPASPVSFAADGTVVRPPPVLARVIDPTSGEVVLVPLPPGKTVDVHTGRIVPAGPPTTDPGWATTTTTTHDHGGTTTTVVDPTTTTEDTTPTTEESTTTSIDDTTTSTDPGSTDTTDTVP